MVQFADTLYGMIEMPEWLLPFIRIPEFVRLRGVRLSNVDSFEFKDFGSVSRWEHGIAVAYLADIYARERKMGTKDAAHLILAALLHDVATPPFAHTAEYVLVDYDHEIETTKILSATPSSFSDPSVPIYLSEIPRFREECRRLAKTLGVDIDADEVAAYVSGEGELGYLVAGTLDLDNADNVVRGCSYMGIEVDRNVPLEIARWLATLKGIPLDLESCEKDCVKKWILYRKKYYGRFFSSSDEELGRQAFLQHLMRRAVDSGMPSRALLWNTDNGLLRTIGQFDETREKSSKPALSELVHRYEMLEQTTKFIEVPIYEDELLRTMQLPQATKWIEELFCGEALEAFVIVNRNRSGEGNQQGELLEGVSGYIMGFKLGGPLNRAQLPDWWRSSVPANAKGRQLSLRLTEVVSKEIRRWGVERPWLKGGKKRGEDVKERLNSMGDWAFRLSRNESFHPYPGTFVHTIPSALLNALALKGEKVWDPFGGTGQTALEVAKNGGTAISTDSNRVATLVARVRLTHYTEKQRSIIRGIDQAVIRNSEPCEAPTFELRDKWYHPETLAELCQIKGFIESIVEPELREFYLVAFSAILPNCTARRGKQHGWFADNTPLGAGQENPPYQEAETLFISRVRKNLELTERFYAQMKRAEVNPEMVLNKMEVRRVDVAEANLSECGIGEETVAGIVTSPPYLCMADYALGQRLSYYWMDSEGMEEDLRCEMGARRKRFSPKRVVESYFSGLESFAETASKALRSGGYLAVVLGEPVAKAFEGLMVNERFCEMLKEREMELEWSKERTIYWHRNQGYQRLRKERIVVYRKS